MKFLVQKKWQTRMPILTPASMGDGSLYKRKEIARRLGLEDTEMYRVLKVQSAWQSSSEPNIVLLRYSGTGMRCSLYDMLFAVEEFTKHGGSIFAGVYERFALGPLWFGNRWSAPDL